jgi:RHS repeat-associated protein
MWVKVSSLPTTGQVFGLFGHNSSSGKIYTAIEYLVSAGSSVPRLSFFRIGWRASISYYDVNLNDGKWHHIGYTYNASNYTFLAYLDGVFIGSGNDFVGSGIRGNDHTIIGDIDMGDNTFAPAPYFFDGKIDDVRVYKRTLSPDEIMQISKSSSEALKQEPGLVAYFKLNNSFTNLVSKSSGLNAVNSPTFSPDVPFIPYVPPVPSGVLTMYQYNGGEYANPHAPTTIGSTSTTTLSYDKNGNLISFGNTKYIYDYNNRLTSVSNGIATSTYAYDSSGTRIKVLDGNGGVTLYPSKYYNVGYDKDGRTVSETSHIFAGDTLLSTFDKKIPVNVNTGTCVAPQTGDFTLSSSCNVVGSMVVPGSVIVPAGKVLTVNADSKLLINLKTSKLLVKKDGGVLIKKGGVVRQVKYEDVNPTISLNYHLFDHLGSITVTTDTTGNIVELNDYYPYGSIRVEEGSSSKEQRKYIGQEFDASTGLSYLNARYYDGGRGQFLNQDPVFWEIGQTEEGRSSLINPQSQNSYSYAGNNPILNSDPDGKWFKEFITGQQSFNDFSVEVGQTANQMAEDSKI